MAQQISPDSLENHSNTLLKDALTFNEASRLLDLSKSYLYKLTHSRQIPHYKPNGKKIYFKRSDLENWLFRNRVSTADELEQQAEKLISKGRGF